MIGPIKWLLGRLAHRQARRMRAWFHDQTRRPMEVQRAHLFAQLQRESPTAFGRDHRFAQIKTLADFRRHVPITTYEYFAPYIERVKAGDTEALFHRQRVLMFAMTSGTTATRKYIPVTPRYLDDYRRGWTIWGLHLFEDHKPLWFKTMVQITSDWDEARTAADIPCGSISGLTVQMQKYVIRKTYCLPSQSAKLKDVLAKYYLVWRLGLQRDVGIITSANPSTIVNLARFGAENATTLIRDIHDGTVDSRFPLHDALRAQEHRRLRPNPARAREIERIVQRVGTLRPMDVWPDLGMLANWTGGSVGAYMRHYGDFYGTPAIRDIGLIASEGRMTIPLRDHDPGGVLEITSSFFEFIPVDELASPQPTVLESHELEEGRDYYILLTTASGLYRYNIFDVVRCLGFHEQTPVLAFLNKGANFANLTGEKISEFQVVQAVAQAIADLDLKLTAFTLAPCWDDAMPFYGLFVEETDFADQDQAVRFANQVESHLTRENSEYEAKRQTLRLGPIQLQLLPAGTWRHWDRERLQKTGGTAEQYKHPCLIGDMNFPATMPVRRRVAPAG